MRGQKIGHRAQNIKPRGQKTEDRKRNLGSGFWVLGSEKGLTLIELLLVLLIIGIASTLVGVLVHKGIGNVGLNTFAKEISATLRYARSHAVAEKRTYSFIIWGKDKAYGLYADASPIIYKRFSLEDLQATLKNSDVEDIRIDFSPQGNSTGGTIEIKSQKGPTWFISVNRVTGKIDVKKIQNSK